MQGVFPETIPSTLYILIDLIFKQHLGVAAIVILILQMKKTETLRRLAPSPRSFAQQVIDLVFYHKLCKCRGTAVTSNTRLSRPELSILNTKKHNVPWSTIHETQKKTVFLLFFMSADRETESLRE